MGQKRFQFEAGVQAVSLTTGDGTQAVLFDDIFQKAPSVIVGFGTNLGTGKRGFCDAESVTTTGFTIRVDSDSAESSVNIPWIAVERRGSERAGL